MQNLRSPFLYLYDMSHKKQNCTVEDTNWIALLEKCDVTDAASTSLNCKMGEWLP